VQSQPHDTLSTNQKFLFYFAALLPLPAQQPTANLNPKTNSLLRIFFEEVLRAPPQLHK
jgi:hypothetical protein